MAFLNIVFYIQKEVYKWNILNRGVLTILSLDDQRNDQGQFFPNSEN